MRLPASCLRRACFELKQGDSSHTPLWKYSYDGRMSTPFIRFRRQYLHPCPKWVDSTVAGVRPGGPRKLMSYSFFYIYAKSLSIYCTYKLAAKMTSLRHSRTASSAVLCNSGSPMTRPTFFSSRSNSHSRVTVRTIVPSATSPS